MALIKCPECNHEMSDTAKTCPNCGYRLSKKRLVQGKGKAIGILIAIVSVLVIVLVVFGVGKKIKTKKEEARKEESQKEKVYRGTDENSAEELRHFIELLTYDKDILEELVAAIGYNSSERDFVRVDRNEIKFCLDAPKMKAAIMKEYGELNGIFFKSEKYRESTFVITIKTHSEYSNATVCGKWE